MRTLLQQNSDDRGPMRTIQIPANQFGSFSSCSNFQVQVIYPGGAMNFPCSGLMASGSNLKEALATGLKESDPDMSDFSVFPNPASRETTVKINIQENEKVIIKLQNILGQDLFELPVALGVTGEIENTIDLASLSLTDGVYFVVAQINGKTTKQKLVYSH
jgi:hypothetical protein